MICTTAAPLKTKILTFNLFLTQILRKVLCVNLTIYCWWLMIMCCLDEIGRFSYFWLSTTINCPRSRLKHPPTSADFQSKQITRSFICFPIMEQHCLSKTYFVPLRIRQLSESIVWFCPNVWSFCVGVTVLLYCIWTCGGTINESAY